MQTTIAVKLKLLKPNAGKELKLHQATEQYLSACSWFLTQADHLDTISRAFLNRETYASAREMFDLNTATLQMAMMKALGARRSYLSLKQRNHKVSPPSFSKPLPVMVRQDCYAVCQLSSGTWVIKLPVSRGRSQVAIPVAVSDYHQKRLHSLAGGSCRQGSLEFWQSKKGDWFVSLTLVFETKLQEPGGVIGVDLGIVKHAVLSTNLFFNGRPARWRKERWAERRKFLQEHGRLSRVKREAGHERRWMRSINHCLSKQIVGAAIASGKAIALEQLTGIRKRARGSEKFNRMLSGWNFRELADFIGYKAALAGVPVIFVDPRETSRRCPVCGHISKNNRKRSWFRCTQCGYQSDADRVGALNIAARALDAPGA